MGPYAVTSSRRTNFGASVHGSGLHRNVNIVNASGSAFGVVVRHDASTVATTPGTSSLALPIQSPPARISTADWMSNGIVAMPSRVDNSKGAAVSSARPNSPAPSSESGAFSTLMSRGVGMKAPSQAKRAAWYRASAPSVGSAVHPRTAAST